MIKIETHDFAASHCFCVLKHKRWKTPEHHVLLVRCGKWLAYVNIYINTFHNYWDLTTVHNREYNSNQTWIHTSPAWASALRRTGLPWKEAIWETKLTKQHFSNSVPFANSMIPCLAFLRYGLCHFFCETLPPVFFLSEIFFSSISPPSCPLTFLDARILDQGLHT